MKTDMDCCSKRSAKVLSVEAGANDPKRRRDSIAAAPQNRHSEKGIALVIVMISIFVLTILAAGFAFSMKVETKLAQQANNETELQWLGRSGMEYARWVLFLQGTCPLEPWDSLNQAWATGAPGGRCATNGPLGDIQSEVQLGHGSFTWKMTDYESKWNINVANEMILQQAMILMGLEPGEMTPVVNSILDWIDPDNNARIQGAESEYYEGKDPSYEAKNGPVDDLAELLLIKGVTPELYWGTASTNHPAPAFQQRNFGIGMREAMPAGSYEVGFEKLFASMGGTPSGKPININTASAAVLQLIPGVDSRAAEAIVGARGGEDDGTGLTGPFVNTDPNYIFTRVPLLTLPLARIVSQFVDKQSRTFEVEVTAKVGGSERKFYGTLVRNSPRDIQLLNFHWKY
jgi:general secretion pathway protein K